MVKADGITRLMERGYRVKVSLSSFSILQIPLDNPMNFCFFSIRSIHLISKENLWVLWICNQLYHLYDFLFPFPLGFILLTSDTRAIELISWETKGKSSCSVLVVCDIIYSFFFFHCDLYNCLFYSRAIDLISNITEGKNFTFWLFNNCFIMFASQSQSNLCT
jgi:hypothetical protein